jgi:probable rRNA maturation factor
VVDVVTEVAVDEALVQLLKARLARLMEELGVGDRVVTVVLTGDEEIRALKREHWGEDAPTDVLSFPTYEPGDPFMPPHLGDIVISLDTAKRQAESAGRSLEDEVLVLAAHALWHLLGHDHNTEDEWQGFRKVQNQILAR